MRALVPLHAAARLPAVFTYDYAPQGLRAGAEGFVAQRAILPHPLKAQPHIHVHHIRDGSVHLSVPAMYALPLAIETKNYNADQSYLCNVLPGHLTHLCALPPDFGASRLATGGVTLDWMWTPQLCSPKTCAACQQLL